MEMKVTFVVEGEEVTLAMRASAAFWLRPVKRMCSGL
jgi:hypothetical protein